MKSLFKTSLVFTLLLFSIAVKAEQIESPVILENAVQLPSPKELGQNSVALGTTSLSATSVSSNYLPFSLPSISVLTPLSTIVLIAGSTIFLISTFFSSFK